MTSVKTLGEIEHWEEFLDRNYHQLSRRIRVESLLDRLRSKQVINQEDQETVLHKYCTQFLKAGLLIDIIKTKGRNGFDKFMESVEYEYPEVYLETTGIPPRKDNSTVKASERRQTSMLLIGKMADLIGTFTTSVEEKKTQIREKEEELREFHGLVAQLKSDLEKQSEEQKMMEDEMKELNSLLQELRSENKELSEELKKERTGRQQLNVEFSSLRQEKLKTLYETSNPMYHHIPLDQCISLDSHAAPGEGKTKTSGGEKPTSNPAKETAFRSKSKDSGGTDSERNLAQLQESNDRLQMCLEQFKNESERCRLEQKSAETETKAVRQENENMKEELKKLESHCKLMADTIRKLEEEIEAKGAKKDVELKIPRFFDDKYSSNENEVKPGTPGGDESSSNQTITNIKRRPAGVRVDPKRRQNITP